MPDTRPDLQSYLLAARRLWWVPLVLAVAALATLRPSTVESRRTASVVVQVPDPRALSVVGQTGAFYDARAVADWLAGDLTLTGIGPDGDVTATAVARPASPTLDVEFDAPDDAGVAERIVAIDDLLARRWATLMETTLAPLRAWAESSATAAEEQLSSVAGDSETAAIERARLVERRLDGLALVDAIESVTTSPPTATLIDESMISSGGGSLLLPAAIRLAAGAFLGLGVIVVWCLLDQKARRRSMIEKNGLTVVAVTGPDAARPDEVPASILAAVEGSILNAVVVGVSSVDDTSGVLDAMRADPGIESVSLLDVPYVDGEGFVDAVRDADAVVLVVSAGRSSYADVFEAARTAVGSGAINVCVTIVAPGRRALAEART